MKKFLLSIMLLIGTFAFAQFSLEHTYDENFVTRIKLEYSGEKYYLYDAGTKEVKLYNADHTPWKTISLGLSANATFGFIAHISEAAVNPDPNIEIVFAYYENGIAGFMYYTKVLSENGTPLLEVVNAFNPAVSEIEGLSDKLIVTDFSGNSKVYSMPGLTLENSYTGGQILRTKLENSGEKYFQLNTALHQVPIYNSNHTLWKTINAPSSGEYIQPTSNDISETAINADGLVELIYSYSDGGSAQSFIVNESGATLFNPGSGVLAINKVEGLANKLFLTQTIPSLTTSVYSLPNPSLEHAYTGNVTRTKLENSGEKYYTLDGNTVNVYNSDHSVWKTINLPVPAPFSNPNVDMLSETGFASDPLLEVAYSYYNDILLDVINYESAIINENGSNLLTIPGAALVYLSKIEGLEDKLVALTLSVFSGTYDYGGIVYSVNPSMDVPEFSKNRPVIFPNPASDVLNIRSEKAISQISLYNATGRIVMEKPAVDQIDISGMRVGFYLLEVTDADHAVTTHKILISR